MDIENNPPQIPPGENLPPENQIPPAAAVPETHNSELVTPAAVAAAPPAAALVVHGEIKSERELQLERQLEATAARMKKMEIEFSEKERDVAELKKIPRAPPPAKPAKRTRARNCTDGFFAPREIELED
jgi:hypothetical protein